MSFINLTGVAGMSIAELAAKPCPNFVAVDLTLDWNLNAKASNYLKMKEVPFLDVKKRAQEEEDTTTTGKSLHREYSL